MNKNTPTRAAIYPDSPSILESTIYDEAPSLALTPEPNIYDELPSKESDFGTAIVRWETQAWDNIRLLSEDASADQTEVSRARPKLLEAVAQLARLVQATGEEAGLDRVVAQDALANVLAEFVRTQSAGTNTRAQGTEKNWFVYHSSTDVFIELIYALAVPYKSVPPAKPEQPKTVADLLNDLRPLDEIQQHVHKCIAPSPNELVLPLNRWVSAQMPTSLKEKQAITNFVGQLSATLNLPLYWRGQVCRLDAYADAKVPSGLFRVRPLPTGNALIRGKDTSTILPLGFDRKSSLIQSLDGTTGQGKQRTKEANRRFKRGNKNSRG